ncbi:phosphatidate cytidylyltransferase [Roseateles oligotrophus]|uniref:Phosphatidate cytidylyltransferase n=1 Tax=Roseateles oligotrophus TaxID=1769250 RepID=A0ABT2YB23_9BURK|nr:phosphatidate cytidylyltransferase [Roseateles oligotrophus]MCV2367494.1 phosphatidate cytidylyltransferase [Roseateles oligotrophus]
MNWAWLSAPNPLSSWTPSQQVGLLFVILFGVLLLTSIGSFLSGLRELDGSAAALQIGQRRQRFAHELRLAWLGSSVFWLAWVAGAVGATLLFGILSFLALREYITLLHTRRADHRSLLLAFFVILPVQYALTGGRYFDLFSVLIPVYSFLAIPVVSALAGDPARFLERNAKIHWGIMVCVYGLSHAPALLLLEFPGYLGSGAFLLFFLVAVVACGQSAQLAASRRLRRRPLARQISRDFSMRAWWVGALTAGMVGAALFWITPFKAGQAMLMAFVASGAGSFGGLIMQALKRDAGVHNWGNLSSITGAVGLLDRIAVLCFAAPVFFHSVRWYFQLAL